MKPNYIIIPLIVLFVSVFGGYLTSQGMDWYDTINLPSFTPPGSIISLVWTTIFILSTISAVIFWNKGKKGKMFWLIMLIFLINAFLNIFWSFLFFSQHQLALAVWGAGLLGFSVLTLVISIWRTSKAASLLLLPYLLWVSFATYLSYTIFSLN